MNLAGNASRENLSMLQAGRGGAAVLVVLYHATVLMASPSYWEKSVLGGLFEFGYAGVEFFFVLSGFIILYAHHGDIGQVAPVSRYLLRRVLRLYPLYLIVTTGVMALEVIAGNGNWARFLNGLPLIGVNTTATLGVAWTLFHEVTFYMLFAILIVNRWLGGLIFLLWFAACLVWFNREPPHYALSSINLLFGIGMACFWLSERVQLSSLWLWCGVGCFLAVGTETVAVKILPEDVRELAFGLSSAIFILGAVSSERLNRVSVNQAFRALGDASFSIYLVHYPVLAVVAKLLSLSVVPVLPLAFIFCALIFASLAAGLIVHNLIERPLMGYFKKRVR